ncbi:MAG: DUF4040 domain-containing protein [Chloroflexi bacterium]|uniref:hydrogen gas-evolving membrane-bound hydrogenase subunit E n=1 Tax=Candidatus Flexifilum breve TaxID=3140694 RepID=UPI0031374403|nr:DUF4040 domain-containing protein [Chloroflexota bacterium]
MGSLIAAVLAPALAALLLLTPLRKRPVWAALVPGGLFLYFLAQLAVETTQSVIIPWVPSLGVNLSFQLDGLALLFSLIISGIGTLVLLYSAGYFEDASEYARFSRYTLIFMTAMLGVVTSANLLLLFIFWEITSLTSYLLIGFNHDDEAARSGARRALIVTGGGGLALMAGFLLLGLIGGSFELAELLNQREAIQAHALYIPALLLIFVGAFTKSAQYPFHFWLPGAMAAPTPASTYLHSATMVKAGVFLLARLGGLLNDTPTWDGITLIVGLITFLYGGVIALRQTDLKAILAYSTVSWLGALVAVQSSNSEYAAVAFGVGVLAHALYKAALFLTAGSVDHGVGTRDIRQLGGLARVMPFTFAGALIAVVSMAGIPPLLGFLSKELLKAASVYDGQPDAFLIIFPIAAVLGSALTVTVALRFLWDTFVRSAPAEAHHHPHEVSPLMWIGALVLGTLTLGLPLALPLTLDPLLGRVVAVMRGAPAEIHLHLFEGITTPLIMSAISITLGFGLFLLRGRVIRLLTRLPSFDTVGVYQWLFYRALPDGAAWLTMRLQNGRLHFYLLVVLGSAISLTAALLLLGQVNLTNTETLGGLDPLAGVICVLLMAGAITGVIVPTRLGAIAILGIEGALLSLLFALFGAPDLAFTQLMIEVVTLVLFVLAFHFLPNAFNMQIPRRTRFFDITFAAASGVVVTLLILAAAANPIAESISGYYVENAYEVGHGHNVVNVILVDFRALDTQGEILVLIIAAIGVTALLRLRPSGQPRGLHLPPDPETSITLPVEADVNLEVEQP